MEAKTPKEFFETVLPTKFNPEKAKDFEAVAQANIDGANGGHWIMTIKNQEMKIEEGVAASPAITLNMKDTDFVELINGRTDAVKAFLTGKIQFTGSISTGLKLLNMGFL